MKYRHTQIGWFTLATTTLLVPFVVMGVVYRETTMLTIGIGVIVFIAAFFGSLTVDIDERRMLVTLGVGIVRRTVALERIRAFAPVTNRWYYGWGVRITPHGMLYNVSGFSAVEILLEDGRRVRVGTDEPQALIRALETATRLSSASSAAGFPGDTGWRRRVAVLAGSAAALIVVWMLWTFYAHTQPPSIEITPEGVTVASGMYTTHVPLSTIENIALVENLPRIERRTNGFGAGGVLRGSFRLEEWGSGRLFINRNSPPFVVIRTRDSFVVVNFDDAARTRGLFVRLSGR